MQTTYFCKGLVELKNASEADRGERTSSCSVPSEHFSHTIHLRDYPAAVVDEQPPRGLIADRVLYCVIILDRLLLAIAGQRSNASFSDERVGTT
jgi:hypothetical protein